MNIRRPVLATVLGIAGLIPFVATGLASVMYAEPSSGMFLLMLLGYGAVILSFLGGLHWGAAQLDPDPHGARVRTALSVVPSLIGWLALILPLLVPPEAGIAVLIVGFIGTVGIEAHGTRNGVPATALVSLRWSLATAVVAILIVVLVLRLIGARVIF
jgi:hypothetical protein